jgi:Xaa-Pro aminopeptidase
MRRFRAAMDTTTPDWEFAAILAKVNLYYFTGTMPEGLLLVPRDREAVLWVRRSYERARAESVFPDIRPMANFRDAAAATPNLRGSVHMETEIVPVALCQRFQKYFPAKQIQSADRQIAAVRAVKSPFELALMERSGKVHRVVLEERVPAMLREGLSEAELGAELFSALIQAGHHGIARMGSFDTELVLGYIAFGENSLYPTSFNGPGGNCGVCPAVPLFGSPARKLRQGDLVFLDVGCGVEGYHTDKTMTYVFGQGLPAHALQAHRTCVDIQDRVAEALRPGAMPSRIYSDVMQSLSPDFLENFMGFGNRRVKFLGHGIGLVIDETPVIAEGFDEPLQEGMVLAVEPKKGVPGIGMVGVENTFLVTKEGGRSLTGRNPGPIHVPFRSGFCS